MEMHGNVLEMYWKCSGNVMEMYSLNLFKCHISEVVCTQYSGGTGIMCSIQVKSCSKLFGLVSDA